MEVKEVNNTLSALLLNKTAPGGEAPVLGAGFADLLNQTASVLDILPSRPQTETAEKTKPAAATEEPRELPVKEKSRREKDVKENKEPAVAEKPAERRLDRKNKVSAEKAAAPAAVTEPQPAPQKPAAAPAEAVNAAEKPTVPAGEPAPKLTAATVTEILQNLPQLSAAMVDGKIILQPAIGDLQALQSMENVQVLNLDNGEVISMSGSALAQMLQAPADLPAQTAPAVAPSSAAGLPLSPAEAVEPQLPAEAGNQRPAAAETLKTAETPLLYTDAEQAAQAAELDQKAAAGSRLQIEVNVNREEKIAYSGTADLLRDRLTFDRVLQAASQEAETPSATPAPAITTASAPQAQPLQTAPAEAMFNLAAALTPAVEASASAAADDVSAAAAVKIAAVTENNPALLSRTGSEFVNAARLEAAKPQENSFKDIYKGMSREVIDQVKVNITKSAVRGVDKIDISLKPEELGHIEIKMQIAKDGKLHAHIVSTRPETMEILQKEASNLEKAFNEAGFSTDSDSLSFSHQQGREAGGEDGRDNGLRHFIGDVFAKESGESVGNDNNYFWDPAKGLNIKV